MSEPQREPVPVHMSSDDVRATLIFLSVAKTAYEFVGRMTGDGEERFAHQRMAIESLSMKFREILMAAMAAKASREIPSEIVASGIDKPAPAAHIVSKEPGRPDKRPARRRK